MRKRLERVATAAQELTLEASLSHFGGGDFFGTASKCITGPVLFTLASGVFLTGSTSSSVPPVPLLFSLPMLATEIFALGAVRRLFNVVKHPHLRLQSASSNTSYIGVTD